jgi:hypothetical protein
MSAHASCAQPGRKCRSENRARKVRRRHLAALRFTRGQSVFTTHEHSGGIFIGMMQRDYTWSSIFAWGLTLSGAVLATGGVIGMFWPQLDISWLCIIAFAGMMAFGIGLVNCSAAGALQAIKHRKPDGRQVEWTVLLPALACCIGFVFATNVGVHLGWEIVISNAPAGARLPPAMTVDAVFYIFAFAKPAMAWIVEGRKVMDAESYAAHRTARRQEANEQAEAEMIRTEFARAAVQPQPEPAPEAIEPAPAAETPAVAAEPAQETVPQAAMETPAARTPKSRRKPKTVEEQRAAAMKAAAKRVAQYREQHMGRVTDIEQARLDQSLTPQQIARACDTLIARGEKPTMRRVAEVLGTSQIRIERVWPQGVPLDGTGEVRAA